MRKIYFKLIKSTCWGLLLISFSLWLFSVGQNPLHQYYLLSEGITAKGFVTNTSLDYDQDDGGRTRYTYTFDYYFYLPSGKKISSFGYGDGKPPIFLNPGKPLEVIYLYKDPNVNLIRYQLPDTLLDIVRSRILELLLFLCLTSYGIYVIKGAICKFFADRKSNQASIIEWLESMKIPTNE